VVATFSWLLNPEALTQDVPTEPYGKATMSGCSLPSIRSVIATPMGLLQPVVPKESLTGLIPSEAIRVGNSQSPG
jgi:hypothetical protein